LDPVFHFLALAVVVVHAAFVVFLVVGGFVAWRWPRVLWAHLATGAWSLGIVTVGQVCPLTTMEGWARRRSGEVVTGRGFIDTYVRGIVFPGRYIDVLRVLVFVVVAASWLGFWWRWRRSGPTGVGQVRLRLPSISR